MRKYKKLFSMLVFIFVAFLCVFSNVSTAQADTPLPCSEVTQPINLTGITSVSTGASLQSTGLRFTYTSGVYRGSDATTPDILDSGTATSYSWRNHSISINVLYTTTPEINAKRGDYIPCDNFYISLPEEVFYVIRKKPSNSLVSSGNGRYDHTAGNGEFEIEYVWQEDVIEYKRTNIYYIQAYATFKVDSIAPSVNLSCKNGEFTNENVTVTYSDNLSGVKSAQYNGTSEANFSEKILIDFSSGRIFNAAGNYTIKVVDNAGWETTKTFTIDKTAPVLTLFGVTDAGYTNKNVSATWTEECTSVTSQLSNPNDQLTVRYARNASGDYPTETTTEYGQGAVLSENGKYLMTISDRAGNSTSYTFTIDKTAPTGTLTNVTDGGYTNKNVTFSWSNSEESATLDGVAYSSGTTISEERLHTIVLTDLAGNSTTYTFTIDKTAPTGTLTNVTDGGYTNKNVTFSWSDSGASATLNDAVYFSGTAISAERQYILVLTDRATNSTTYTFTIDKTAPKLTVSVGNRVHTNQGVTVSYSDTGSSASGLYGREESLNYPTANTRFSSGREFSNEGSYTITVTDLAGNTSSHYFTIDKTAPVIGSYPSFTNSAFTLSAQDKYGSVGAWEYRLNGGTVQRNNDAVITLGGGMQSNGVWNLRAIDELGNTSNWVTVNHAFRETFGNADNVANAYNAPTYYVVTLSQKNYVSCFGSYTFAEYDHALSFAIEKEWACRVIKLDGGKSWNYVTATNENARQIYTDRSELNAVIERYARRNISDRRVVGKNGVVLNNPTDAHGVTRADALTVQLARLPALLNAYSGMRFMLAQQSAALETPQRIVDGNKSTATIQFISDGISVREGQVLSLRYGDPLSSVVNEQGWYMIIESDICGNDEKYLIYIDLQQPDLTAKVAYGNGESDIIAFNQSYVDENTETMRYTEFSVQNLSDNIDQYSMIAISGRNLSGQYVWGDELPVISYENGYYGSYTITIYDRSLNTLELTIYIAGAAPTLKHTSLTNETA